MRVPVLVFMLSTASALRIFSDTKAKMDALKKPWRKVPAGTIPPFRDPIRDVPTGRPRAIEASQSRHWPNQEVPYIITGASFTGDDTDVILASMAHIETHTCISFRPKEDADEHWIDINHSDSGCYAHLGYYDHLQVHNVNLQLSGCVAQGVVVHELLHILGVNHEQNRPDRDTYLEMFWENVDPAYRSQYFRVSQIQL